MTTMSFATPVERLAAFFDPSQPRETYEDAEIDEIASLLERCMHAGSKCPRTYIVLRTIGELDVLQRLLTEGFTDQWFPVEHRGLPSFLSPSTKSKFVQSQSIVMTKSMDLEHGRHRHFAPGEPLPFDILGRLGSGGYGQVDKIASKISFRHYALKRIRRRAAFGNNSKEAMKRFKSEIQIVKSIEHRHIIQYVGSYTDKTYLGLVMAPVADTDLAAFLEQTCVYIQTASSANAGSSVLRLRDQALASEMSSTVRTYFGCLAAALSYLHDRSIKHKDVKPQNILVHQGNVLLTDFGLSRDFAEDIGSTTSGITPASPRYSPPEVAVYEARNTSADVWSLGCVFIEMVAALHGHNVDWMKRYFAVLHSTSSHYYANPNATSQLIREWESTWTGRDRKPLQWIENMLQMDRLSRPTAAQVFEFATSVDEIDQSPTTFCGICCVSDEETDSCDSLVDEPTILPPLTRQGILSPPIIQPYHEVSTAESTQELLSVVKIAPEASTPATTVLNVANLDTAFIADVASIEAPYPSNEVEPEQTRIDHDNGASLGQNDSVNSLTQSKMPITTINRKPLTAILKKEEDLPLHRRIGADELPKMVDHVHVGVLNEPPPVYDPNIVVDAPNETLQSPPEPPPPPTAQRPDARQRETETKANEIIAWQKMKQPWSEDPPPSQDRWVQIRKNAADRAARLSEEQSHISPSQSQSQRTDEGETSGEETIESRVARIKARVAELTGTTEGTPTLASGSLPESQKAVNKDDEMDHIKLTSKTSPKIMDRPRRSYFLPNMPVMRHAREDSSSSLLDNSGFVLSDGTVGSEEDFRKQEDSSSVVKGGGLSSIPSSPGTGTKEVTKRDLKSWWSNFSKKGSKSEKQPCE
jgi:serine/threonine protein kinase